MPPPGCMFIRRAAEAALANTDLALVDVAATILKPIWEIAGMS